MTLISVVRGSFYFFDSYIEPYLPGHPEPNPQPEATQSTTPENQLFCLNSSGIPVLKEVDLDVISRVQLVSGLTDFLKALWRK